MPHPLCLSPCPLFCSFYWMTCSERTEKLLSVQHYQSPLQRMMKWRKRSWQAPYCRTRRRRAVARAQGKHPHPLGSSLGGGSTTQLNREDKQVRRENKERRMMLTRVALNKSFFISSYKSWSETTYSHPSCRTSASWLSSEWQFQHKLSDAPSATREATYYITVVSKTKEIEYY